MIEGSLVVVVGQLDKRVRDKQRDGLVIGTFLGKLSDKRICVLLPDGDLYVGEEYTIVPYKEQE